MASDPSSNNPLGGYGLPPTGGTTTKSPIGVPTGYKAPTHQSVIVGVPGTVQREGTYTAYGTAPRGDQYTQGDQWSVPLSDPESIPQLQQALIDAGLLNPKSVRLGTWDVASANAYSTVLGFANAYGLNANQALQVLISNPKASATANTYVDPVFTNPADVQTGFQNISQNLTGQEQDPAAFAQSFHAQEAKTGHQAGTSYTQAPSITGAATQYLEQHNHDDMLNYGVASRMNAFFDLLRSG